ncbi:MAG: DivIVA domain-containing protein [Clostridia bacterium]|nr:DivIVA domain-containing protein [Clostridia bacterium]
MLTPLDIENKRFSKQMMNGYSVEEVDEFLDEIGVDYAKKNKELLEVSKKVEDLNKDLERYRSLEDTLQNTLVMAQSTAEEVKNVAKQQAEQLVAEAKSTAEKEANDLEQQIIYKKKALEDLQKQFDIYKAKMESLLISQLELIKEVNKDN